MGSYRRKMMENGRWEKDDNMALKKKYQLPVAS